MSEHDGPRAAIIGAGLMGQWHADAVRKLGGRVTMIVDPDEAAREALGRRHSGAVLLPKLDPALLRRHATAAHVCTPLSTHVAIVSSMVEAGVHALVEKPFTENAATASTLFTSAKAQGVILCPVHQFLFQDGVRQLVEWLPTMGELCRIEFSTCSAGAAGNDRTSLDDLVAEILPHPLSLTATLVGARVGGARWQVAYARPGELRAVTTLGGAMVDVAISAHGRPTENVLRIVGTRASAVADLFHGFAVRHPGEVSRRAKITHPFTLAGATLRGASTNLVRRAVRGEPAYPGLRVLVGEFYAAVRGERSAPIAAASVIDVAEARDRIMSQLRALGVD